MHVHYFQIADFKQGSVKIVGAGAGCCSAPVTPEESEKVADSKVSITMTFVKKVRSSVCISSRAIINAPSAAGWPSLALEG